MNDLLIIDTETTGLGSHAEIIEVAIINSNEDVIYHDHYKPKQILTIDNVKIHGITNEYLKNKDSFNQLAHDKLLDVFQGMNVWAYNASFDSRLLLQTCKEYNVQYAQWHFNCIMNRFNNRYNSQGKWFSLVNACKHLSVDVSDLKAHSAVDDCKMALRLLKEIIKNSG